MRWAMSSGAGVGNAVAGVAVDTGVGDIDNRQFAAVQPRAQARGGDCGDRRGISEHELDPRRRGARGR